MRDLASSGSSGWSGSRRFSLGRKVLTGKRRADCLFRRFGRRCSQLGAEDSKSSHGSSIHLSFSDFGTGEPWSVMLLVK